MAFTHKSKRYGYDNIANGSAAGVERIVAGSGAFGDATTELSVDALVTSTEGTNTSFIADRPVELLLGMGGATSSGNYVGQPSSATTPFYTSETSWTSAINELNTAI